MLGTGVTWISIFQVDAANPASDGSDASLHALTLVSLYVHAFSRSHSIQAFNCFGICAAAAWHVARKNHKFGFRMINYTQRRWQPVVRPNFDIKWSSLTQIAQSEAKVKSIIFNFDNFGLMWKSEKVRASCCQIEDEFILTEVHTNILLLFTKYLQKVDHSLNKHNFFLNLYILRPLWSNPSWLQYICINIFLFIITFRAVHIFKFVYCRNSLLQWTPNASL